MKTNFAYVVMKITEDDAHVLHMCFYEEKPDNKELSHLIDELENDPEFNLVDLTLGIDYDIYFFEGEKLTSLKNAMHIPDELEDSGFSNLNPDQLN